MKMRTNAKRVLAAAGVAGAIAISMGSTRSLGPAGGDDHGAPAKHAAPGKPSPARTSAAKAPAPIKHDDQAADDEHPSHAPAPRTSAAGASKAKPSTAHAEAEADDSTPTADEALERMQAGNQRWVEEEATNPHSDGKRRKQAAGGQKPFAAVLTCADSRLPVERIFDQGVGDLFVVRVAGNVAGTSETGTMEYGAEHLNVPLLVVMGHTKCGAVAAAAGEGLPEGPLGELVAQVKPSVERARKLNPSLEGDAVVAEAIKENVWQTVFTLLKTSPVLSEKVRSGELKLVGAVCDVSTGKVEWLGEHPWQAELCEAFAKRGGDGMGAHAGKGAADDHADAHAEAASDEH